MVGSAESEKKTNVTVQCTKGSHTQMVEKASTSLK